MNFLRLAITGILLIILAVNFLIPIPIKINKEWEETKKEIVFWQKTVEEFPGYRDGYLKLAILNWKIYQTDEAKSFLEKARTVDPNNRLEISLTQAFTRL